MCVYADIPKYVEFGIRSNNLNCTFSMRAYNMQRNVFYNRTSLKNVSYCVEALHVLSQCHSVTSNCNCVLSLMISVTVPLAFVLQVT